MSDFTIAATDAPQYNPYAPLSAMGQLAQQNQAVQSGAIQNQSALLNLSLQKARLQPVISALQGYGQGQQQPSSSGLAGMAQNAPPVAPGQPMNSGAAGPGGNVTSQPLAAPGGGQGTPVGLAPGGPPPGTPSGGSDGGGYQLPPGAGDMSQGLIGVAVPVLALAGAMGGSDPTGDIQKLVQTRAQWLETGAQQANTPQAWNSFVMSAYQNGWATSADAGKLLNNFGMRDSVLKSYASPDEQLKATAELAGGGMGFDPTTGTIGPNANAISAAGDKAGAVEGGQILAQTQLKPGEIAAETPGLVARAGGEAAAGEAAKAPYTPVSVPVRNADGSTTSVTMPSSQYAATYGGVGGGAAAAGGRPNDTNPGNIRAPGGGFRTYDSPQAGVLAMSDTLQGYGNQGVNTIAGVVGKYAPPSENDTSAYVAAVSKATGFAPDQKIDLSDPNVRYKVMQAMLPRERGNGAAALAGLGGGSGAAPASGGAAAPPPAAGGAPSGPPTDGPIPTNPVAGPPLPASNTGANPNVVPNGITPGPGQVAAPPVPAAPAATPPAAAPPAAVAAAAAPPPAARPSAPLPPPLPQGTGFAPPATPPGLPPGAIVGGYTPSPVQQEQIKENLTANTAYQTDLRSKAQAASQQNALFDQITQQTAGAGAGGFTPGGFAPIVADARKALDSTASLFGIKDGAWNADPLASYQAYQKNVGLLSRQAMSSVGTQGGIKELEAITATLPSGETSPQGIKTVTAELQGMNDYMIAKSGAAARYSGNPSTFDAAYNANVSPTAFIMQRIGQTQGMPALQQMLQNIAQQPNGAAIVARMKNDYLYAQRDGLFDLAGSGS